MNLYRGINEFMPRHKHTHTKHVSGEERREMIMTMLMKQFGKSVLVDCGVDRCIQLGRNRMGLCGLQYGPYNKWAADISPI